MSNKNTPQQNKSAAPASAAKKPDPSTVSEGFCRLHAPEGATGCSFDSVEYEVDPDTGTVDVPAEAVAGLIDHGYLTSKKDTQ